MPSRSPIGLTFCPILCLSYSNCRFRPLPDYDREMGVLLFHPRRPAAAAGVKPLQPQGAADSCLLDIKAVDIELMVVLGIRDRRLQRLLDLAGDAAVRERQFRQRRNDALAANRAGDEVQLARTCPQAEKARQSL